MRKSIKTKDQGFILVVVLCSGILLALMATAFSVSVRSHVHATAGDAELARAETLADGGVNLAILDIITASAAEPYEQRFTAGAAPVRCAVGDDAFLSIQVEDESGKVDLNAANEELLAAVFTGLGSSDTSAHSMAARILDYRDADDESREGGAEAQEYEGSGKSPKNAPFDTVDELQQVSGLPTDLIARAKIHLTVYTGLSGLDERVASPGLLSLLQDFKTSAAGSANFVARSAGRVFSVRTAARMRSGALYISRAVVEFQTPPSGSYSIREWRRDNADESDDRFGSQEAAYPPC